MEKRNSKAVKESKFINTFLNALHEQIKPSNGETHFFMDSDSETFIKYQSEITKPKDVIVKQSKEWGRKSSGKWNGYPPKITKYLSVYFPLKEIINVIKKDRLVIEDMVTLSLKKIKSQDEKVIVYKAEWLKKGMGINATIQRGYIAEYKHYFFHSTSKKGIEERVISKRYKTIINKRIARIITRTNKSKLDKIFVTREDSYKAGNCKSGTENFIQTHNITKDELSLRELLSIAPTNYRVKAVVDYALIYKDVQQSTNA